ncbi:MAG: hypothetical protein ACXABU_15970 [Candidatus Hodarchaeales archaeon]|jgi:hypothetical protein
MLIFKKYQDKIQLMIPLSLPIALIISFFTLSGTFTICDTTCVQFTQNPKEANLQTHSEKKTFFKQDNCDLQNYSYHSSQIMRNSIQNQELQEVGCQRTFWIWDFTTLTHYEINATILAIGKYSYIFMENSCISGLGESVAIVQSETIRDEFDDTTYPRVTDLAGHPNGTLGDIDGDPRIIILLCHEPICYYSQRNEQILDYSNQCEMFYIYSGLFRWGYNRLFGAIAHEFHHLIWFNNEMDEPQFILEALAEYAMYHSGYLAPSNNLSPRVTDFLSHPEDSLLHFNIDSEEGLTRAIDYGGGYLFAFYIAEHYGVEILQNLILEPADGPHGVENVLQAAGYNITFNEIYLNWITTVTIDELGFNNNLYGFENIDARISRYDLVHELPIANETISLRYYGFHIHKLESPPNNFTIKIKKASNQTIGVSVAFHDAFGWHIHQNLHDEGDTRVTDHLLGNSIDVAYIITSYMLNQTPIVTRPNYGLGPLTNLNISIIQTPTPTNTTNTTNTTSIPLTTIETTVAMSFGSNVAIVVIVLSTYFVLLRKNRK